MAHKGTIFLDEIGDLELSSQVKLLRVLQDRTYEVLGSSRTKIVDTRVICATNRTLEDMVLEKTFREDLLYRINLITVRLPSLRERPSDIPLLVNFFLQNLSTIYNRPLSILPDAMRWLQQLQLTGNIRQLKNLVERTVLVSPHNTLEINDLKANYAPLTKKEETTTLPKVGTMTLEEMEKEMIQRAMDFHKSNVARASRALGLTRAALYRRLEKFGIPFSDEFID